MPDGCEGGFNRVGRSQVLPVLCREVVKRQQGVLVLSQFLDGLGIFGTKVCNEAIKCLEGIRLCRGLPDLMQRRLGAAVL